jgi:hypothetical protein
VPGKSGQRHADSIERDSSRPAASQHHSRRENSRSLATAAEQRRQQAATDSWRDSSWRSASPVDWI